jgi:hypothetical protein
MAKPQGLLSPLERQTYESFGIAPREDRLSVLPRYSKQAGLIAPQFIYDAAKALAAPYTAAQGYYLPPEEAVNVGMNMMGGSAVGTAPKGALRSGFTGSIKPGAGWMGKSVPNVEKLAKNQDKFLYHSDVAKNVNDLHYGIDPQQGGSWIKELAQGATDNPKALLESQTPMAWFSDKPEWVKMKVARELNKSVDKVTVEDIKNHGHLAIINKKDPYLTDIWRVGNEGLSEGSYSKVQNLKGEQVPAYQTNMYQEGNYGNRLEPFGVERNEWVSTQSVEPFLQLTGDDLVRYLELTKNLDAKKIKAKK